MTYIINSCLRRYSPIGIAETSTSTENQWKSNAKNDCGRILWDCLTAKIWITSTEPKRSTQETIRKGLELDFITAKKSTDMNDHRKNYFKEMNPFLFRVEG